MDGSSFDQLTVGVHRLRDGATRRNALRVLAGGAAAVIGGAIATPDTDAKKKNKNKKYKNKYNKCKNHWDGGFCNSSKDCCNGKCRYGICWYNGGGGSGGGGKGGCGGVRCPSGWTCRKQGPAHICSPYNNPNYCGNNTYWGNNYTCCNGYYGGACLTGGECCGLATCCQPGWRCCGGNQCIPNGWDCNDFYAQSAGDGVSTESIPSMAPTAPDANDSVVIAPGSAS